MKAGGIAGHCKVCHSDRARKFRAENPEIAKLWNRKNVLIRFNLTIEQYEDMLVAQEGVCKICRRVCATGKRLAVDHDKRCCPGKRSCGKCIRGLICLSCNTGIGKFNDDPDFMRVAIKYLEDANE